MKFAGDGEKAYFQNKWVRTRRFEHEAAEGFSFALMGEGMQVAETGSLAWLQHIRPSGGRANTAMVWNAPQKTLLALFEADRPYAVDIETLDTTGYVDEFGGHKLKFPTFTAHPKVCPITGDMFFFGYINGRKAPWLHYGVIDGKSGKLLRSFPIDIPAPVMMHDIAITANYVIFYDYNNKYYAPEKVMAGEAKSMYEHDQTIPARFGVLPRMAKSDKEIIWIDAKQSLAVFHFANGISVFVLTLAYEHISTSNEPLQVHKCVHAHIYTYKYLHVHTY